MLALGLFSWAAACRMVQSLWGSHLLASLFRLLRPWGIFSRCSLSASLLLTAAFCRGSVATSLLLAKACGIFWRGAFSASLLLDTALPRVLCTASLALLRLLRILWFVAGLLAELPFAAVACVVLAGECERTLLAAEALPDADLFCGSPSVKSMVPSFLISLASSRLIMGSRFTFGSFFAAFSRVVAAAGSRFTTPFVRIHALMRS
mmetsp:Transcript_93839/g.249120  ORF Transcript_93839/g.249120 Transcript_93839/m.249120 type:complete len:206 (+) Transcript_93839:202-819(+)